MRRLLYALARLLGGLAALGSPPKMARRVVRKTAWKAAAKGLRKLGL